MIIFVVIILLDVAAQLRGKEIPTKRIAVSSASNADLQNPTFGISRIPLLADASKLKVSQRHGLPALRLTGIGTFPALGGFSSVRDRPKKATQKDWLASILPQLGSGSGGNEQAREVAKKSLFKAIEGLSRGVDANEEEKAAVDRAAQALERLNPRKSSLSSDEVNGEWELVYTTSESILGANRLPPFRPWGPIYQTIDAKSLRAKNRETWPFFNSVEAELTPTSASAVDVQFKLFRIFGILPVRAPENAKGALDITYVDRDVRVSRGDKGNLFVLTMSNPTQRLNSTQIYPSSLNIYVLMLCSVFIGGMVCAVLRLRPCSDPSVSNEPFLTV